MPSTYVFELHLTTTSGNALRGGTFLSVNFPKSLRWSICSTREVGLYGLKGSYDYRERFGNFNPGTIYFEEGSESENPADALFRLDTFKGGIPDYKDWDVGKTGEGSWVKTPKNGIPMVKQFSFTVVMVDDRDKPLSPP